MKVAFYLNVVSPHQLPLAREVAKSVGEGNFRYVYAEDFLADRKAMGWNDGDVPQWCVKGDENMPELIDADFVYTGIRCHELMAKRAALGKKTAYYSERWFKPALGFLRLLFPPYCRMATKFVEMLSSGRSVYYLPQGIYAARDMASLCGLMHGDLRCLFEFPELDFERKPGGRICLKNGGNDKKYCLDKMLMWGYYVAPSKLVALPVQETSKPKPHEIKVLWVGRLLNLKRVDTIVRAVGEHANLKRVDNSLPEITLDIYGTGPDEARLKKMATKYGDAIKFYPSVPIEQVRKLMREHDVYVLASNGYEGWGAVVSEALEEGMKVVGTYEAGSSATILPESNLFHAGDWHGLKNLLAGDLPQIGIGAWSAKKAANELLAFYDGISGR